MFNTSSRAKQCTCCFASVSLVRTVRKRFSKPLPPMKLCAACCASLGYEPPTSKLQ